MLDVIYVFIVLALSSGAHAYNMLEYFPLTEGNTWEYDRDYFSVTGETASLGGKTAYYFMSARSFYEGNFFISADNDGIRISGLKTAGGTVVDLSSYDFKGMNAEMQLGDSVITILPAGVLRPSQITVTSTLLSETAVTVPTGSFPEALKLRLLVEEGSQAYTEDIWLVRSVGIVKVQRVNGFSYSGCVMSCGSFDYDFNYVEAPDMNLLRYRQASSVDTTDTDGDGVIDSLDSCADTPAGSVVDSEGCAARPKVIVVPL